MSETTSRLGRWLILIGLAVALFAMALDAWTRLRELELVSGCIGLITSVTAAIIAAFDLTWPGERRDELSGAVSREAGGTSTARRH